MTHKHILIIGKSPAVLQSAAELLRGRGYKVDVTDNFDDIATRYDLQKYDLITTGGQVPVEKRAEIRRDASAVRPDMLYVQGLAGIPGLIAQQIEGELAAQSRDTAHPPTYDASTRELRLFLQESADVKIIGWWQTTFVPPNPGSDSLVVADQHLSAGEQVVSLPSAIPKTAAFVTVQVGKAIYALSLAPMHV